MAKLQYNPGTIIPTDQEGLQKYLQEELDKIAFTFANADQTVEIPEEGTGGTVPVDHNDLLNRDAPDTHPMAAITGLLEDQARQDLALGQTVQVFFQPDQPTDEESSQGDIWFKEGWD